MNLRHKFGACFCGFILLLFSSLVSASEANKDKDYAKRLQCGSMAHSSVGFGPFDYTNYEHFSQILPTVELHHFNSNVQTLKSGQTAYSALGDLDYILRAFPNHHRALAAVASYEFRVEDSNIHLAQQGLPTIECYFWHAVEFKPDDGVVRLIYGSYLHKKGMLQKARVQYEIALEMTPDSPEVHYNLGLFYYDLGNMGLAVKHGRKAYEIGYPLPGLKDKLIKKGVWDKIVSQN